MKRLFVISLGLLLALGGPALAAEAVIDFETSPFDVVADATYQAATPFAPGVLIETINNLTGVVNGWPIVVRAHHGSTICPALSLAVYGTVGGFDARFCGPGNTTRNYPVPSGYNSLSDTNEWLAGVDVTDRIQDGMLVTFSFPVSDVSLWFADWGDYFPPAQHSSSERTWPAYIQLVAYAADGSVIAVTESDHLNNAPVERDAALSQGIIQLAVSAPGIRQAAVFYRGWIDPGVTVDDIAFTPDVQINIKPGSDPNSINTCANGATPVAIFGSSSFDVATVDPEKLVLASSQVKTVGKSGRFLCSQEDIGAPDDAFFDSLDEVGDGYDDLVCHFITLDLALGDASSEAELSITGCDDPDDADGCLPSDPGYYTFSASDSVNIVKDCNP